MRAAFQAHDIPVVINGEHHASMLGGLAGTFIPLHIVVAEEDAETAAALLRDLRDGEAASAEQLASEEAEEEWSGEPPVDVKLMQRRRTLVVVLLALCLSFGTAHMYTRAWFRGLALAGLEILAIQYLFAERAVGGVLLVACVVVDLIGALWRVHNAPPEIPRAVARSRS